MQALWSNKHALTAGKDGLRMTESRIIERGRRGIYGDALAANIANMIVGFK